LDDSKNDVLTDKVLKKDPKKVKEPSVKKFPKKRLPQEINVEAVFLKGKRGIIMKDPTDGYMYCKNHGVANKMYWRCKWYRRHKCKATAVTCGFKLTAKSNPHNHPVITGRIEDDL